MDQHVYAVLDACSPDWLPPHVTTRGAVLIGMDLGPGEAQAKVADWLDVCGIDWRRDVALTVC